MTSPYAAHDTVAAALGSFPTADEQPHTLGWPWGREQEGES